MDILSVDIFRNAKLAHVENPVRRVYGECTVELSHRKWYPPVTKNGAKFDCGRGLLPGGTYPLYPRRRRSYVEAIAKVQKLNFGVGPDPPIRTS